MNIPAENIKVGNVILPPAREINLWMRRHCQEHGLSENALHLTVTEVREGTADKRGRWLIVRALHNAEWGENSRFPFTFKVRPDTSWPLIRVSA